MGQGLAVAIGLGIVTRQKGLALQAVERKLQAHHFIIGLKAWVYAQSAIATAGPRSIDHRRQAVRRDHNGGHRRITNTIFRHKIGPTAAVVERREGAVGGGVAIKVGMVHISPLGGGPAVVLGMGAAALWANDAVVGQIHPVLAVVKEVVGQLGHLVVVGKMGASLKALYHVLVNLIA